MSISVSTTYKTINSRMMYSYSSGVKCNLYLITNLIAMIGICRGNSQNVMLKLHSEQMYINCGIVLLNNFLSKAFCVVH